MRKLLHIAIVSLFSLFFFIPVYASQNEEALEIEEFTIQGKYHDGTLSPVMSDEDYDSLLRIQSMDIKGECVFLEGVIEKGKGMIKITDKGLLMKSVVSENSLVGMFDETKNYNIISFVIERSPQKDLLLKTTNDEIERRGSTSPIVLKIAIEDNAAKGVYYFETAIPDRVFGDIITKHAYKKADTESEVEDLLYRNERWFLFYQSEKFQVVEASLEDVLDTTEMERKRITENRAVSPVQGMDASLFKREGTSQMTIHDLHGWYMTTVGYPSGSGNYISTLIKWSYTVPSMVKKGKTNSFKIEIMASGEYFYRASDDTIEKWTDHSSYRMGSVKLGASLKTARGDIFAAYSYDQQYNNSGYSSYLQILGLWKRTSALGTVLSLLNGLSSTSVPAHSDVFHDKLYDCGEDYGYENGDPTKPKAPLFVGISTPKSKKMYRVHDRLIMNVIWKKPVDASNYYTYVTGNKTIELAFKYSVYSGSTAVLDGKTKTYSRTYK